MNRAAVLACVVLVGCSALDPAEASTTPAPTLAPLATVTLAGMPSATTQDPLSPMPAQSIPTTTQVPRLNRETQLAIRRCVQAIDNDFLPLTLKNKDSTAANDAIALCNEATVQLQVEPSSDFVDYLLEQLEGTRRAIGLASLSARLTDEDAARLGQSLNGYVARINLRLDEIPELP